MIVRIECENFYSIGRKIVVDFSLSGKKITKNHFYDQKNRIAIAKVSAITGLNATGKTSVLRTVSFFRHLICGTIKSPVGNQLSYEKFIPMAALPSSVSITAIINGHFIRHSLFFSKEKILSEEISERKFHAKNNRFVWKKVCGSKWSDANKKYICFFPKDWKVDINDIRADASIISVIARYPSNKLAQDIYTFWNEHVDNNANLAGSIEVGEDRLNKIMSAICSVQEDENIIKKVLNDFGINFNGIIKKENGNQYQYFISHEYGDMSFLSKMKDESSGTRRLFDLLPGCIYILSLGGVVMLDEMDAFLNPYIVKKIINLFTDDNINKLNAQLIFSSHNVDTIGDFEKNRLFLCRNVNGYTELARFDEFSGLRGDVKFLSKYLNGDEDSIRNIDTLWNNIKIKGR